jgi:hypothetical protein
METSDPDQEPGLEMSPEQAAGLRQQLRPRPKGEGPEAKRSRTDPEARFLRERGGKFRLGYSGELAVSEDHFIVAVRVTQNQTDNGSLLAMVAEVERHCRAQPEKVLADSGFYGGANLDGLRQQGIDGYIPDSNLAHELNTGQPARGRGGQLSGVQHRETRRMRKKLRSPAGRAIYDRRKTIGYSGEGERRFRREAERRSGAKVNSSRSEATLA